MSTAKPARPGLWFAPGNHTYRLDGKPVPGVTTILGVLDKPAIPKWAARTVAEYVADNMDAVEHLRGMGRGPMVDALRGIPWQRRDDAAARGTTLHDFAERILRGEDVEIPADDPLVPVVEHAIRFMEDWQIEPVLIEAACGHRGDWWAGTLDLGARYVRPDTGHAGLGIFDWKSGKGMYPEYAWQLNAYAHAEFHGLKGDEAPMPTFDAAFGVQIRPDGYGVAPFAFGPEIYDEFVLIRRTYAAVKAGRGDWRRPGTGHVGVHIQAEEAS